MPPTAKVSARVVRYEPGLRIAKHAHDETQLTLLFCGQIQEIVGDKVTSIRALDVIVKPSGTEHENEFGASESLSLQVSIPTVVANRLQSLGNGLGRWHRKLNPFLVSGFLDWAEGIQTRKEAATVSPSLSRLRDIVMKLSSGNRLYNQHVPDWLDVAMHILEREFRQPITVTDIAKRCSIHPVSLTRACRQSFGETISQRKLMLRTQHAASLLAGSRDSLAAIAVDCGFVDQSHLSRVFKSLTGRTPGAFRRLTSHLAKMAN